MMIVVPLVLLLFTTIFYGLYLSNASSVGNSLFDDEPYTWNINGTTKQVINGSETEYSQETIEGSVGFDLGTVVIALLLATFTAIIAASILVLFSGIGSKGVSAIGAVIFWYGLFVLFSGGALLGFLTVPALGLTLYFVLLLCYSIGVYESVN